MIFLWNSMMGKGETNTNETSFEKYSIAEFTKMATFFYGSFMATND